MAPTAGVAERRQLERFVRREDTAPAKKAKEAPSSPTTGAPDGGSSGSGAAPAAGSSGPTATQRHSNVVHRDGNVQRFTNEGGAAALRARLEAATPTSLLTERLDDEEENCLELAAEHVNAERDRIVFMDDRRTEAEGNDNGAGHALIQDRETGRVWDPMDGAPPADSAEWGYADVDAWVDAQGTTTSGDPAYAVDGRVDADKVQEVLALPPEARAARIDAMGDPELSRVAANLYADADAPQFDVHLCNECSVRSPEIEDYLDTSGGLLYGEDVTALLAGETDLGELTDSERTQVLDIATNFWRNQGGYDDLRALTRFAAEDADPELRAFIQNDFAERAVAYQTGPIADEPNNFAARNLSTELAIHATELAGTPEARREMLEDLGTEGATAFALAFEPSRDDGDYFINTGTPYGGWPAEDDARLAALGDVLEATAEGDVTETSAAIVNAVNADLDGDLLEDSEALRHGFASALGEHWYPNDALLASEEAERMESVLGTDLGREVLYGDDVPLASRAEAMNLVRASDWTGEDFESDDFLEDEYLPALATPRAEDFLEGRGDDPIALGGTNLENTIGFAFGLPPEGIPEDETQAELEAREAAVAAGEHSYYDGNEDVEAVADQIREVGGEPPEVTVLPVQYYDDGVAVSVPLFRVQDEETGEDRFVDNAGRRYDSFDDWRSNNQLPPGKMTYPVDGHLARGDDGEIRLATRNTPETVDSVGEHITGVLDRVALVGGIIAGGALLIGSGGTAAPIVLGGAAAWGAYRSGDRLLDRYQHGQSINPITDGAARSEWLNFGANVFAVATAGTAGLATRAAGAGGYLRPSAAVAAGYLGATSAVLDGAAAVDATYTLFRDWDELDGQQRAQLALSAGFFGVTTLVGASQNPGGARDLFNPRAMRDAYLSNVPETTQQLWRLEENLPTSAVVDIRDHVNRYVPEGQRAEVLARVEAAAADGNIIGLDDWITYNTRTNQATSDAAVRQQLDDNLAELTAARGEAALSGERIDVGGDLRPATRANGDQLRSFDLVTADGSRNIEVYSPDGDASITTFNGAINHAAAKIIDDPSLPPDVQTTGTVEAALVTDWPPPGGMRPNGMRHIVAENGDVTLLTADGRVIPRGNLFDDYVTALNDGSPTVARNASQVDRLAVYDREGALVYEFVQGPDGVWSGSQPE